MNNFKIKLDLNDNKNENKKETNKKESSLLEDVSNIFNDSIDNDSQKMLMLSIISHIVINSMKDN
tara:strand:- start:246 stop:440 length:195 start_codon:yes stop_codon:yes gene_type:complete